MNAAVIARQPGFEGRFFVATSFAILLLVFIGFARTCFLKLLFFDAPALTPFVHLHGALMSAWFVVFAAQTCLVLSGRVDWHRRLGVLGVSIALGIVAIAPVVLIGATVREIHAVDSDKYFYVIFSVDAVLILDFVVFVATPIAMRRRPDMHKRLMLLATASIVLPAIGRLPLPPARDLESLLRLRARARRDRHLAAPSPSSGLRLGTAWTSLVDRLFA